MRNAMLAAALFLSSPAWADNRWITMPRPAPMPAPVATGKAPVNGIGMYFAAYDDAILRPFTDHIAAVIPGSKLIILPGVSHFAMLQAPDDYTAAVRAFID